MSLKERMAALQRGAAPSASPAAPAPAPFVGAANASLASAAAAPQEISAASPATSPVKPPVPGKLSAERRNIAFVDAALGGSGTPPPVLGAKPAPTRSATAESKGTTEDHALEGQKSAAPIDKSEGDDGAALDTNADTEAVPIASTDENEASAPASAAAVADETAPPAAAPDDKGEATALSPEEEEAQRRAAIAQRMARLGGQRVGAVPGGMGMFGRPPPAPTASKPVAPAAVPESETEAATAVGSIDTAPEPKSAVEEAEAVQASMPSAPVTAPIAEAETAGDEGQKDGSSPSGGDLQATASAPMEEQSQKLLAVPRRAGPPRRKKGPAPSPTSTLPAAAVPSAAAEEQDQTQVENEEQSAVEQPADAPEVDAAPELSLPAQDEHLASLEAEPVVDQNLSTQEPRSVPAPESDVAVPPPEVTKPSIDDVEEPTTEAVPAQAESLVGTEQDAEEISAPQPSADTAELEAEEEDEEPAPIVENRRSSIIPPRPSSIPPIPPVRPPSVPIPVTSPPPPAARPPIPPTSPAPPVPAVRDFTQASATAGGADEETAGQDEPAPAPRAPPAGLVRPQAKMGITVPLSEAEEAEADKYEAEAEAAAGTVSQAPIAAVDAGAAPDAAHVEAHAEEAAAPAELTEEEQEAQRRAAIARRMAALGGQRMGALPGLANFGAPMPRRTTPKPATGGEEGHDADEAAPAQQEQSETDSAADGAAGSGSALRKAAGQSPVPGGVAIPGLVPAFLPRPSSVVQEPEDAQPEQVVRLASPPPVPISPAPPLPRVSSPPVRDIAASRSSTLNVSESGSISRPSSTRPVIPVGLPPPPPSAAAPPPPPPPAAAQDDDDEEEADEEYGLGQDHTELSPPVRSDSIPAAPMSPPPPPPPGKTPPPPARSPMPIPTNQPPPPPLPSAPLAPALTPAPVVNMSEGHPRRQGSGIVSGKQNARDLDLMPSSRWWRRGGLQNLPPSLAGRNDAVTRVEEQVFSSSDGSVRHVVTVHVLFQDYSQTVVDLDYVDDDADETQTDLSQRHLFPPVPPDANALIQWHQQIGAPIAAQAEQLISSKNPQIVGDGSAYALPASLIAASPVRALGPIGASFGAPILHQAGPTVLEQGPDEIRPGDVLVLFGTEFKGKKAALSTYHHTFGSAREPAFAVLVENESKKNRLRVAIQSVASGGKKGGGGVEEVSLRMDDLRAGVLKVFRVAPAQGWLE
ncbi:assembly of actin patch protein [Tilletia horrida]|uniref:Assembly of actin patch protein n=1 Tax=Tilletia horrida TaxID=155126 RepID=A0AAN6JLS3_9BASI|nr:assembly of actin patch protein [Tilletia horrida]